MLICVLQKLITQHIQDLQYHSHAPIDVLLPRDPRHDMGEVLVQTPEARAQVLVSVKPVCQCYDWHQRYSTQNITDKYKC